MTVGEYVSSHKGGIVLIDFDENGETKCKKYPSNLIYQIKEKYLDLEVMDISENENDFTEIYVMGVD